LGEEKQLGTWGWHLTLPVSRLRQWAVKVSFALLTVLTLGILLPAAAWVVASGFKLERPDHWLTNASPVLLVAVYATVLSFWAVTMLGNVVRAVLFSLLGAGVLFFGGTMMLGLGQEHRLLQGFSHWLVVEFQFLSYDLQSNRIIAASAFVGLTLLLILLLRQSYAHCRREPSLGVIIKCSISLIVSLFLPLWLGADITSSFRSPAINALAENLGEAVSKLPSALKETAIGKSTPVSLEEIDKTGFLNSDTKRWLRGTSIQIVQPVAANSGRGRPFVQVGVRFPSGRYFETATPLVRGTPLDH
jgi:hypothetical protein